jgi:3'-phosphoadenosine 5'-phosphosulfate sulfotransferase (PAPS reductase)/FAD synthetase
MHSLDLTAYDIILVNTSAGKDSQAMLDYVYGMAVAQGVSQRVVAVHCDLGRSEWAGTRALAQTQCDAYNVPLHCVSRDRDLLSQVEHERGMWPSSAARFCTSDHKRDQVAKVITQLVEAFNLRTYGRKRVPGVQVRVLNCIGLRAQESKKRRQEPVFRAGDRGTSGARQIDRWLPVHDWTEAQVWALIKGKNLPYHRAYDLGMPRLSCVFCIFAPKPALLIAGYHNRELLDAYVGVEQRTGHTFKSNLPLVLIQAKLEAGWAPAVGARIDSADWEQCA